MPILETEYNEKAYGKIRFDEGYDEGLEQGKQDEKMELILAMSKDNIPVETIAKYTRLTVEEVNIVNFLKKYTSI